MEENLFHLELHLSFGPSGMLLAQSPGLEPTGGPIQPKGNPQLLSATHATENGDVFRGQLGGHAFKMQDHARFGKADVAKTHCPSLVARQGRQRC